MSDTLPATNGDTQPDAPTEAVRAKRNQYSRAYYARIKRPYRVGAPLPYLLNGVELMRALNYKPGTFRKALRAGKFRRFEVRNPSNPHRKYSGTLVMKHMRADIPPPVRERDE